MVSTMSQPEIMKDVYEAHRSLSDSSAGFIDFVRRNPEGLRRSHFDRIVNHPVFNYYLLQPWPTFINEKTKTRIAKAGLEVFNLIRGIPGRVFDYDIDKISRYYEIPPDRVKSMLRGVDNDSLYGLLGRGDFVMSPSAGLKCIEYNVQASLGGWEQDFLEVEYADIPVIAKFLRENRLQVRRSHFFAALFDHITERAVKHFCPRGEEEINSVLVFKRNIHEPQGTLNFRLRELYQTALRKQGGQRGDLYFSGFNELRLVDNVVMYGNKRLHALVEMHFGKVAPFVMAAFRAGNLHLYNGPIVEIMSSKLNLALLSEYRDSGIFSGKEQEIIREYIPWTRKITPGETHYETEKVRLADFMISHREKLVIKSPLGYGGYEVTMGFKTPLELWKKRVERSLSERNWVVQEYIRPGSLYYQQGEFGCVPHHVVWGVFIFGSRYAGGFVRVMPEQSDQPVINLNQGAEQSTALEVEE